MLVSGDKLVVTKDVAGVLAEGEIVEVVDVSNNGMISFAFGENFMHKGLMSASECEEHFEKIDINFGIPVITQDRIDEIMEGAEIEVYTAFDRCTILSVKLANGFMITESYTSPASEEYNEEFNLDICWSKIEDKLWEMERYRIQEEIYRENERIECCGSCCDCCEDDDDFEFDEFEDDEFENLNEDDEPDCSECDDFTCPSHPFNS